MSSLMAHPTIYRSFRGWKIIAKKWTKIGEKPHWVWKLVPQKTCRILIISNTVKNQKKNVK